MQKIQAESLKEKYTSLGYQVDIKQSPLTSVGWEIEAQPAKGANEGENFYIFEERDLKFLILAGQVRRKGS